MLVIEGDRQVVGRIPLRIERYVIMFSGMNVLAGLTDTIVALDDRKTILLREVIYRGAIAMCHQICFGDRIGEVNLQVA